MSLLDGFKGAFAVEKIQSPTRRQLAEDELKRVSALIPIEWHSDEWGNLSADVEIVPGCFAPGKEYNLHIQRGKGKGYDYSTVIGETDEYLITGRPGAKRVFSTSIIPKTPYRFGAFKLYPTGEKVVIQADTI